MNTVIAVGGGARTGLGLVMLSKLSVIFHLRVFLYLNEMGVELRLESNVLRIKCGFSFKGFPLFK